MLLGALSLGDISVVTCHDDGAARFSGAFECGRAVDLYPTHLAISAPDAVFADEGRRIVRIECRRGSNADARNVFRRYPCKDRGDIGLGVGDIEDLLEAL